MGSTQASLWGRYRPNFGFQYDFLTQIALCLRYPVSCVRRAGLVFVCVTAARNRAPGVLEALLRRTGSESGSRCLLPASARASSMLTGLLATTGQIESD